uniref:Viral membrane protein n=1 Tax=Rousettus bat poxvirus TaxID=3141933 RepID=A0AAU7E217_9POXV
MADRTTVSVNGLDLEYVRAHERVSVRYARVSTLCFFFVMLVASAVLFVYQISEGNVVSELRKYSRLKHAILSWRPLVDAKVRIERERGRQEAATRPSAFNFRCVDFGPYFVPVRLDRASFLPQAVRRGRGDGWMVKKAARVDPSAQQFCEYVLDNNDGNTITCGTEMFDELGYSGYFEAGHWCSSFLGLAL